MNDLTPDWIKTKWCRTVFWLLLFLSLGFIIGDLLVFLKHNTVNYLELTIDIVVFHLYYFFWKYHYEQPNRFMADLMEDF